MRRYFDTRDEVIAAKRKGEIIYFSPDNCKYYLVKIEESRLYEGYFPEEEN
jgi:hypothetical protein